MPEIDRKALQDTMFTAQMALGWTFPNAVMQSALPDLEDLTIDIAALTRRRDRLVDTLCAASHDVLTPEGTFYLWGRWPEGADPVRSWNALADRDVFVLPGEILGAPGHFRICLTASDAMVDRALPAFSAALRP